MSKLWLIYFFIFLTISLSVDECDKKALIIIKSPNYLTVLAIL